jgi:uncharacterized integral membrane protein (TIGR00698 family)
MRNIYANPTLQGLVFVVLCAIFATYLASLPWFTRLSISPLIIGIALGMLFGNLVYAHSAQQWQGALKFSTKTLLRLGVVLYGFRLTFQDIHHVGVAGIIVSISIVVSTFLIGYWVGIKWLKLDRDTTILISAGSSICGAAAVLATESVLKPEPHKTSIAIASVVIFGTLAMCLYPLLYQSGILSLNENAMGIYLGGTLHEVAHVVGAGNAINASTADTAVIVKMLRVMLLAPFLFILSVWLLRSMTSTAALTATSKKQTTQAAIPWFALGFIAVVLVNSVLRIPTDAIVVVHSIDTFLLTMAMLALGIETRVAKFKGIGLKPFYLGVILFIWLLLGGLVITRLVA